ncbi:FtsX-like permease family protein [Seohaeicola zhoushanensis]|uniref:ABC transporter permease n=1 Tax=Seohaeicola zhoushanensis TaxID=1569283 RepID=A0A8J3GZC7_9RHOB|nr:ABC transporter permease [Seohaeicola zhoushanensis]
MIAAALGALLSHWRRQPGQFATLVLGLALATALWSAVQAINAEARASYARAAAQLGGDAGLVLKARSGAIPLATYVALRRAGWQVSPVLEGRTRIGQTSLRILGVDGLTYPVMPASETTDATDPAAILLPPGRLFVTPATAEALANAPDLPPRITTPDLPEGVALTDIGTAERLLARTGEITRLLVLPDQPAGLPPLSQLAPDLELSETGQGDVARLTDSFHLNLTAFGLLSFAVGLFIVHGTAGLAFEQRRAMFRTLRALGLPARTLTLLVLGELLALALLSGLLGLVLGYFVAAVLLPDVAATLRGLYGAPVEGGLTLRPAWVASGLGMAVGGALLAGVQGVVKVARMPILAAPGLLAWSGAARRGRWRMALAGPALMLGGVLALWQVGGLLGGFMLLGGLMLGAALLLPPLLAGLLALGGRCATGVTGQWLLADLRAQLPGLTLALMALLLALATNVGVGTMVSSFRLTFTGWLDQRLTSELYIYAESDRQGAALEDWLRPRTEAVLPIRYAEAELAGAPGRIYGIVDHATYRDNWPIIAAAPGGWDRVADSTGVLVNEQLARREGLWPGTTLTLGPGWQAEVVGVYSDYGNPNAQAIVAMPALLAHVPNVPNRQFGIRIAPEKAPTLAAELRAAFDLPETSVVDNAAVKAASLAIFEKTFVVTAALNVLTLGVAGFAILTSLLTLWTMRLPHVAPVWAMGMTRKALARIEILRSLALAGLTALLALPLGLVLAKVLLDVINVTAFGWQLPMYLFPLDWLRLLALALLAGALAAALPATRLRRLPPADLLKVFAHER